MEVIKSDTTAYGYTVSDNRVDVTDYQPWFDKVDKLGCRVVTKCAEHDSKSRLHYHGVILIKKGFFRKRLMMPGLHVKLVEIYDREGWDLYCNKQQEEEIEPPSPKDMHPVLKEKIF